MNILNCLTRTGALVWRRSMGSIAQNGDVVSCVRRDRRIIKHSPLHWGFNMLSKPKVSMNA